MNQGPWPAKPVSSVPRDLAELLDLALGYARDGASAPAVVTALQHLSDRFAGERLQVAVVGQFKRGKSTLINALLGLDILPTGVLPMTAGATFIEYATLPALRVTYHSGRVENEAPDSVGALRARLADLVTEGGNPKNAREVAQVTIGLPAGLLKSGIALIDTPGVGSTLTHNTAAAAAALPACDVALFVVSPDPPLTEIESAYLQQVAATAARVVVILNKADLVEGDDLKVLLGFLREAVQRVSPLGADSPILPVSAAQALAAKMTGDPARLASTGLPDVERCLETFGSEERRQVLDAAIATKAQALLADLRFQNELALQALRLPLDDLERRGRTFAAAVAGFQRDRQAVADLLAGDEKRVLAALDDDATELRARIAADLSAELTMAAAGAPPDQAWRTLQASLPERLKVELDNTLAAARGKLEATFAGRQETVDRLFATVVDTAAEIMELDAPPASTSPPFEARILPYWVTGRPEALNPLPPAPSSGCCPAGSGYARRFAGSRRRSPILRSGTSRISGGRCGATCRRPSAASSRSSTPASATLWRRRATCWRRPSPDGPHMHRPPPRKWRAWKRHSPACRRWPRRYAGESAATTGKAEPLPPVPAQA